MSTGADILKAEIEAGTFTSYRDGATPSVIIEGKEDLRTVRPDEGIQLRNANTKNMFAGNGARYGRDMYIDLKLADPDSDQRDNLIDDLEDVFEASDYDITFDITGHPDQLTLFITTMRVKILN